MKLSLTGSRRKALAILTKGRKAVPAPANRNQPSYFIEPNGSIMVREEPTTQQARAAAQAILDDLHDRGIGESAKEALLAVRKRLG